MALQNRVGLGRKTFSFQFHFEKKIKLAQNAELQKFLLFFFRISPLSVHVHRVGLAFWAQGAFWASKYKLTKDTSFIQSLFL